MRVFIALLFEKDNNDRIDNLLKEVKEISDSGNFTSKNNLHLTLQYLGETSKEELLNIKKQLSKLSNQAFLYKTDGIKYFIKSNSRIIVYVAIEKNKLLEDLYFSVRNQLEEAKIDVREPAFKPHITLGRKVRINKDSSLHNIHFNNLTLKAKAVSIMESKRVNNTLIYKELFKVPLN